MHSGCKRGIRPCPPPLIVILFVTILFAKPPNRICPREEKYVCLQISIKTLYDGEGGGKGIEHKNANYGMN